MTERLYYTNSYQTEFEAEVVDVTSVTLDSPNEVVSQRTVAAIELAKSYFYPTSGGQAFDTGVLGDWQVIDVLVEKNGPGSLGRVLHLLDADFATLTDKVVSAQTLRGVVDWPRRYDHMQQHSGQHLLSHAFFEKFGYETVSVHFGPAESTLDLATDAITSSELRVVEQYVNEVVYASLPIKAYFVGQSDLSIIPLRRPPKVSGEIRVVEIEQLDYSACGGTHCRLTGELGPIKLLRTEKSRKNTRVAFVCGWRALADYGQKHQLISDSAHLFSTEMAQVPDSIERLLEQNKALNRQLSGLTEQLLTAEATTLAGLARSVGDYRVVTQIFDGRAIDEIKILAGLLQKEADLISLFTVCKDEKLTAIFARGESVPVEMGTLLRDTLRAFGGNGGGRPEFAQGGNVDAAHAQAIVDSAVNQLQ